MKQKQPFLGRTTVTMEYEQIRLAFFKTNVDGNLIKKWPCSAPQYYDKRAIKLRKERAIL
jgi:hypothetical protein